MTLADIERKSLDAIVEDADNSDKPHGGFTAVLSTPSLDRDGDVLGRDEWIEPLPERLPLDIDHNMTVEGTIGSFRPYFDDEGRLMMDATFASTPKAQEVRTLIKEGHIRSVSVAFMTDRSKKDGTPRRELLNAGVVAIPSNRDAVILNSKAAKPDVTDFDDDVDVDVKADSAGSYTPPSGVRAEAKRALQWIKDGHAGSGFTDTGRKRAADLAAGRAVGRDTIGRIANFLARHEGDKKGQGWSPGEDGYPSPGRVAWAAWGGDPAKSWTASILDSEDSKSLATKASSGEAALIQAVHDAACHLGAMCCVPEYDDELVEDDSSAADKVKPTKGVKGVDLSVSGQITLDQFKAALESITSRVDDDSSDVDDLVVTDDEIADVVEPQGNSPAEPPAVDAADEAAPSVEDGPAESPADATAGEAAESEVVLSSERRARDLAMAIFAQEVLSDLP